MSSKSLRITVICVLLVGSLAATPASPATAADSLTAGFAEADITPEIGMEVSAGYGKVFCREIHDPCKVRAAVLSDGKTRVALVSVDGGFIFQPVVQQARAAIQQQCGIPPGAVLIGATHSHSSGPLGIVQPGEYGGGYETRLTSCSNLEVSAGRQIVDMALKLAGQMKPAPIPLPPKAPPFREPWSYGNVPPELQ